MRRMAKSLVAALCMAPMFASAVTASPGGSITLLGPITISHNNTSVTCTMELIGTISASNGSMVITNVNVPDFCSQTRGLFYGANVSSYWTGSALTTTTAPYSSTLSGFSVISGTDVGPQPPSYTCAGSLPLVWSIREEKVVINPTTITAGGTSCIVSGTLYLTPFQYFR